MNKKDCKIIQDLLPNYVEGLTNDETNKFVEEHLKECKECNEMFSNMKKEFYKKESEEKENVNFLKKHKKQIKRLKLILLIILAIFIIVIGRRTIIMMQLSSRASESSASDNYYAKLYSYRADSLTITESYNKGEDYLTTITRFVDGKENYKMTFYKKGEENLIVSQVEDKKYLLDAEITLGGKISPVTDVQDEFLSNLMYSLIVGINSTYCNGREAYLIEGSSYERYIDKETGFAIRSIEKVDTNEPMHDIIVDYEYKFNVVQDSDIQKPDTTGAITNN